MRVFNDGHLCYNRSRSQQISIPTRIIVKTVKSSQKGALICGIHSLDHDMPANTAWISVFILGFSRRFKGSRAPGVNPKFFLLSS